GKTMFFSGGRVAAVRNKQYNYTDNDYEITFDEHTRVQESLQAIQARILPLRINPLKSLGDLVNIQNKGSCDIVAAVLSIGEITSAMSKRTNKTFMKAVHVIGDESGTSAELTVWGEDAENSIRTLQPGSIIAISKVSVSDFGGRTLSVSRGSEMTTDQSRIPTQFHQRVHALQGWYQSGGPNAVKAVADMVDRP
ncbi:hypothetical protein KIPB_014379, partial [Kipferlia bialata]